MYSPLVHSNIKHAQMKQGDILISTRYDKMLPEFIFTLLTALLKYFSF